MWRTRIWARAPTAWWRGTQTAGRAVCRTTPSSSSSATSSRERGPDTIAREIDEAIQALPEGYDTVCTDGMFSQGERQLLSIARAAAADPAVLLLDEITANLDAETEARVREALRQASRGRTVLSVSHRIYESLGGRTVEIRPQGQ